MRVDGLNLAGANGVVKTLHHHEHVIGADAEAEEEARDVDEGEEGEPQHDRVDAKGHRDRESDLRKGERGDKERACEEPHHHEDERDANDDARNVGLDQDLIEKRRPDLAVEKRIRRELSAAVAVANARLEKLQMKLFEDLFVIVGQHELDVLGLARPKESYVEQRVEGVKDGMELMARLGRGARVAEPPRAKVDCTIVQERPEVLSVRLGQLAARGVPRYCGCVRADRAHATTSTAHALSTARLARRQVGDLCRHLLGQLTHAAKARGGEQVDA